MRDSKPKLIEFDQSPTSLTSASTLIPPGVYTTFRTFDHSKILPVKDQIKRLEDSADLVGIPISLEETEVKEMIRAAILQSPAAESRIRLTVDLQEKPGTLYLALEPLQTPSQEDYTRGVFVVTYPAHRDNPLAKRTRFLSVAEKIQREVPPDANEALMVGESGEILEGLTSNFFGLIDGELRTAGAGILLGLTRSLVLEVALEEKIPVSFKSVSIDSLSSLQEAFLTSSSRSVLPVRQIDQTIIGDGRPGKTTRKLSEGLWRLLRSRLIEII